MKRRFLTHDAFVRDYGERFRAVCQRHGAELEPLLVPADSKPRLDDATLAGIEIAGFTGTFEADPAFTRRYLGSALRAPNLRWMHLPNAGVDHPVFAQLLANGVRLTNSSGASAEPIAQTAIAGMLALARGFPDWWRAQQQHEWRPHAYVPQDLRGQTMLIVGLGAIGNEIARLARAFGLYVVGVRRSAERPDDEAQQVVTLQQLEAWLPRTDWLVLACPLTPETRGLVDARRLGRLPATARLINVARGAVVDEAALIAALQHGHLAGAYLDVVSEEPLPPDSPLWDLPQVILSPHDSSGSSGNRARISEIFLANLERWLSGEALVNEVRAWEPDDQMTK